MKFKEEKMKLISCYIENFGLLRSSSYNFSKGLNCCISENGTGKTTLTAFIEAMLYGIGDTRRQALDENPRKKYMPWQGGKFGGSLTVEVGKRKYIIERTFGQRPADDTFRLIDADSGRVSEDYGEDIGERLFGIDRDGFLRTAFLSEKNLQGKNENKSISAKLSDLVGVDGDVGGFDDALKLLEERRKFYFKKGNTGEIANVKERINEAQRKLDSLSALEKEVTEKEAVLKEMNAERATIKALEDEARAKLESVNKFREKRVHEERYRTMLEATNREKARLEEVRTFFASGLPSSENIDAARDAMAEAERLKAEALAEGGNEEYVALGEFFKKGTNFTEIANAERLAELAEEKEKEITSIDNEVDPISKEMRAIFPDNPPTRDSIVTTKKSETSVLIKMAVCILGNILLVASIILGGIFTYTLGAVGFIISISTAISLLISGKKQNSQSSKDRGAQRGGSITDTEKKLDRYEQLESERAEKRTKLSEEYSDLNIKVCEFLSNFPIPDADSVLDAVRIIRHKYTRYYALGQAGETIASGKLEKLKRSEALAGEARAFLKRFPTSSENPFAEIRDKLNQYSYLKTSVERLVNDCDMYAVQYGVTDKPQHNDSEDEMSIKATLAELTEKTRSLSANTALIEREVNIARAEIDKKDEYEMAKEELDELYRKHVDSLEVIRKTSLYLKEACDNITSKYLGKTKEKFEEYSKLIAGIDGDYTLNTSFELMRIERGESHGIEAYSRGTRDLYALGLRLALIDALYENEAPFIILDDPFIALDDARLERAKSTLKMIGKSKQILYFTCSKSRAIE